MSKGLIDSIDTFDIINKSLGLAKTGLGKLVFPLKSKYVAEKITSIAPYTNPKKGNILLTAMFTSIYFNNIFKGVYKELNIYDDIQDGEAPKNGIYFRKLDNFNIVIMNVYPVVEFTKDDEGIRDTKYSRTLFIGADCEKWKSYFSLKANNVRIAYDNARWDNNDNNNVFISTRVNFDRNPYNRRSKKFDDIVMKEKQYLISIIDKFISNEKIYIKNNIPHRLGCLFYGLPGTGKSSLAYTIANHVRYSVVTITQEYIFKVETGETPMYRSDYAGMVILLDEIDSFLSTDQNGKGILRKEQLFSFIDKLPEDSILVATTNFIDNLDDALTRSGRFDIKMEMKYFDEEDTKEMIKKFEVDPLFINRYTEFPIRPSDLQFDLVQEVSKNILS